jgi:hypothetical protein
VSDDFRGGHQDAPDPPLRRQVFILWRERQWRLIKSSERHARAKLVTLYLGGAAALAAIASFVLANWPSKKG